LIVAVTGGRGTLGRAVTALALQLGHEVVCIDRAGSQAGPAQDGLRYQTADLTCYDSLSEAVGSADAMVHLAAYVSPHVAADHVVHNNNVVASYNALSVAAERGLSRVCIASSVNAIGGAYSNVARYDYFPVDENHPTYAEDGYSVSKWIAEQQAAAFARREPGMAFAAVRLHALRERSDMNELVRSLGSERTRRDLWGYTPNNVAAQACLAAITVPLHGFETFYVVAQDTAADEPSLTLRDRYYPNVPVVGDLSGHRSFFDSAKAARVLGIAVAPPSAIAMSGPDDRL
jgi:nucleoside-diphosphate-sugar epimerase